MKKFTAAFTLIPNAGVSFDQFNQIIEQLASLGSFEFHTESNVQLREPTVEHTQILLVYISSDDEVDYQVVDHTGETEGRELSQDAWASIRFHGICTTFYGTFPRPDVYGVPMFATNSDFAAGEVSNHHFVVSPTMEVVVNSTSDDSPEEIWLTIAISDVLFNELMGLPA